MTILRRESTVQTPAPRQAVEVVEVTYVTDAQGVRSTTRPVDQYRPATDEELAANPRYRMVPVDKAAEDAEREAIAARIALEAVGPPASFDLP